MKKLKKITTLHLVVFSLLIAIQAVNANDKFQIGGYGVINYFNFDWDTDSDRRASIDVERFVIASKYKVNDNIRFEVELEFEHGGTGVTMEFDKLEEFGEFEMEVEKGGEVIVEKLAAVFDIRPELNFRVGHIIVPIGLIAKRHRPQHYFTMARPESESNLIPSIWHENGIEIFGKIGYFNYQAQVVNGLDSTGFSSRRFIVGGHQLRFENANAENFSLVGRLDYSPASSATIGLSGYYGNTADNRPKPDLRSNANVGIFDLHGFYEVGSIKIRGLFIYGLVQNSALISKANRSLSNNLNVKRTPVGSKAYGGYAEVGYNLLSLFGTETDRSKVLDLFVRYDNYDTMADVEGEIFDNPRWKREAWTFGLNYHPHQKLVFKCHYSARRLETKVDNKENTFGFGMGFQY